MHTSLRMHLRWACLILFSIAAADACAQATFSFDAITTRDRLPDNYVLSMLLDRMGFMWLGTRDGLARYDGHSFTIFKHDVEDDRSIAAGGVDCLCEDASGELWIGTSGGGLDRFDRVTGAFVHHRVRAGIGAGPIGSIVRGPGGDLWVIAGDGGSRLYRLDRRSGKARRYEHDPRDRWSVPADGVTSMQVDPAGRLWLGTERSGILRYDRSRDGFVGAAIDPSYRDPRYRLTVLLHADRYGLWCRRSDSGIFLIRMMPDGHVRYGEHPLNQPHLRNDVVQSVLRDHSGRTWIATAFGGLHTFDDRGDHLGFVNNPAVPTSLVSNTIFCMVEDRSGNLWAGTNNGIARLNRRAWHFTHYRHDPFDGSGLSFPRVRCIRRDRSGTLWVGTGGGGLDAQKAGTTTFVRHDLARGPARSGGFDVVNTLYEDRAGVLWVGTNGGLVRLDRNGRRRYYVNDPDDPETITRGGVWDILETRDGTLWVGTLRGGLCTLDRGSGRFRAVPSSDARSGGPTGKNVHALFEDRAGRLWVGGDNGADCYDPVSRSWRNVRHDPSDRGTLRSNRVWYFHEDRSGILWIATSEGGISRLDPTTGRMKNFTEKEGLASNMVCGILEDRHGMLWISTNSGLSRLDPRRGTFKSYHAGDGLPLHEFHFKACFSDGRTLLFGGNGGVIAFDPDSIEAGMGAPPVAITSFRLFGSEKPLDTTVALKRTITLDHGDNFFTIEFAALDFTNPPANRYRYRLEGFDADWRSADGTRPVASYTNVPPGVYRFVVAGAAGHGAWSRKPAVLEIVITPAFWQTLWFRMAAVALASGAIVGLVLLRMRAIRRKGEMERRLVESQLRALQAQMNPHFVFNSLSSILHFITTHDNGSAYTYLTKFSRLMRLILDSSRRDTITLAEEIDALTLYLDLESLRHRDSFGYVIDVDPAIERELIEIPPMVIQPYVENAVKHGLAYRTSGGMLRITMSLDGGDLVCTVEDNGIGRRRSEELKRNSRRFASVGMGVTADRLEILTGLRGNRYSVSVVDLFDGEEPAGTRVDLRIPME